MTAGLDGGATAAALGVSAGVTYDGALTLLSGKRKGALPHAEPGLASCSGFARPPSSKIPAEQARRVSSRCGNQWQQAGAAQGL
jgi:hypothetical protein